MLYILEHENHIEQGDICYNLPKILPSYFISEIPGSPTWEKYIENIKNNTISSVKFSFYPSPTWGVVLSQTCEVENAEEGASIIFAELKYCEKYQDITSIGKNRSKTYIKNVLKLLRYETPSKLYLPKLCIEDGKEYGPWKSDFRNIFFVPVKLIEKNLNLFWKARLKIPAVEVLKEKIRHFFTRLAFEESIFFTDSETEEYIICEKRDRDEVLKVRRSCGV